MTRKDFELIANIIYSLNVDSSDDRIDRIALVFADRLKTANDRFDRSRFLEACGVTE